jgi:hypothetical protein
MDRVFSARPQLDQQHPSAPTPSDTERMDLAFLREQNRQLRDLVVQLSRLVVRNVLEK